MRHFLTLREFDRSEIESLFRSAARFKAERAAGRRTGRLNGRTVGMIFDKPSTRTRVSFEVGVQDLGGRVVFMHGSETQLSRQEPISHAARVLSRYLDAMVIRTYSQAGLEEMARFASIPVINALTDMYHPCQVLSDMFTIWEKFGKIDQLKIAWLGDGNNMAHSWLNAAAIMDFELSMAVPEGYDPDPDILAQSQARASVTLTRDPVAAVTGAQVVNTDVWASMGQEQEAAERALRFKPYQLDAELLAKADPAAIVLHCLPAHIGEEIAEDVFEGPRSVVFDQAENRLHAQKALLEMIILGGAG